GAWGPVSRRWSSWLRPGAGVQCGGISMIWRLRLHRLRRLAANMLRLARAFGVAGAGVIALGGILAPPLGLPNPFDMGWSMLLLGLCLMVGGVGYALSGEAPTVQSYAEGDTEEMPGLIKLISGLVA